MRKPTLCICENKDTAQLCSNRKADQCLFRYLDSTIPLIPKCKISSLQPSPVAVQPGLCQTWSESTLLVFSRRALYVFNFHKDKRRFPMTGLINLLKFGGFNESCCQSIMLNLEKKVCFIIQCQLVLFECFIMPPTLKKWVAYWFWLVRGSVRASVRSKKNSSQGFEISYMYSW